jgi:hypothetical protein
LDPHSVQVVLAGIAAGLAKLSDELDACVTGQRLAAGDLLSGPLINFACKGGKVRDARKLQFSTENFSSIRPIPNQRGADSFLAVQSRDLMGI